MEAWSPEELKLLEHTFLFRRAGPDLVRQAAGDPRCSRERFPKGRKIYTPAHFRRSLGVVLEGRLQVTKDRLVVSVLRPGELFGAAALFHNRRRFETTITALTPAAVAFLPQDLVEELLARSPALCSSYIAYLSERIHFLSRKIEGLTTPGALGKLSKWLLEAPENPVSCSATELSRRLDVSRASLYRAFDELQQAGAIRRAGKTITILDPAILMLQNGGT